ncbi:hypothetical protein HS041_23770 [Planomonospora sp. ID67723]|uniref:hypothetical protein n=1 Tax=Planomonospora sp. ID67723 TaxID=2738134 RepID=UPI0018C3BA83|nr:hypothetical protein [Planomonospora sp. ID67723]MBG0830782.1 hypothetical protein [Planomonospora sp. ID67723]
MTAVIVSLVAVVLLVLVVVALGMRSMNRRESALPAERLREMAEKEASTPTRSTDEFAAREPKMDHFTPDLSPFDEPKPRPPRPSGARGKRGVNEFGEPDDYDDDYWTRLQADEGGFGGSLAAKMGASRPVDQDARPQADPDAVTVQAPLPSRPQPPRPAPAPAPASSPLPAAASASLPSGLADLVGPVQPNPAPSAAALAEQKTVTFAAPTPGAFGESRTPRSSRRSGRTSASNAPSPQSTANPLGVPGPAGSGGPSRPDPLNDPLGGSYPHAAGSPASSGSAASGALGPALPPMGPTTSGGFPVTTPATAQGADPLAAPYGSIPEPQRPTADNPWAQATTPGSGGWAAVNTADILDDPTPSYDSYQTPVYSAPASGSYEVSSGWATIEDDALTGPSPAVSTSPSRAVSPYDRPAVDIPSSSGAGGGYGYESGSYVSPATPAAPAAWPEPAPAPAPAAAPNGNGNWPSYGDLYGTDSENASDGRSHAGSRGSHHRNQEPDYPDYYR